MQRNNEILQKITHFAEDKGFFLVLGLCIIAIGVSGYVLFFTGGDTPVIAPPEEPASSEPSESELAPVERQTRITVPVEEVPQTPAAVPIEQQPLVQEPEPTVSVSRPVKAVKPAYCRPVEGAPARGFSGGELCYDETMADWRTHDGADYLCEEGTPVCAIADGTVSEVRSDGMRGNLVVLGHDGGLQSTYCGLQTNTTMRVGMEIRAGEPVGTVGGELLMESAQPCHLHLEVTRDGASIDPESLFD